MRSAPAEVALILNVLYLDGYIQAGKYIIDSRPEPCPVNHHWTPVR